MTDVDPRWRSPLAHRAPLRAGDAASLKEAPFAGLLILRGRPGAIADGVKAATGLSLPAAVRGTANAGTLSAMWLGPDEWLILGDPACPPTVAAQIESALDGVPHQTVDVSDYYTAVEIGGTHARHLLAKLMATDLHPRHFRAGEAIAATLARSTVWLWLEADAPALFRLFVRRSHADYLWCLLAEAGREWGLPAQDPIGRVKLHLPHFETG